MEDTRAAHPAHAQQKPEIAGEAIRQEKRPTVGGLLKTSADYRLWEAACGGGSLEGTGVVATPGIALPGTPQAESHSTTIFPGLGHS